MINITSVWLSFRNFSTLPRESDARRFALTVRLSTKVHVLMGTSEFNAGGGDGEGRKN